MARLDPQINVRVPNEVKDFLATQARMNGSSRNSELIRCVRERMSRITEKSETVAKQTV